MANNKIDWATVLIRSYDEATNSLKMSPAGSVSYSIELDADDGDSVQIESRQIDEAVTGIDETVTGIVSSELVVKGINKIRLYTDTTIAVSGEQVLTLQVSPAVTGDVWVDTTLTITPSVSVGVVMSNAEVNVVAKRARVKTADAVASGSFDLYILGNG